MLRVAFVLRSTEILPVFLDLFSLASNLAHPCAASRGASGGLLFFSPCDLEAHRSITLDILEARYKDVAMTTRYYSIR